MKNDHVGVGNQDFVWVGIMGSQGPQESELGGQRSRQSHPQGFQDKARLRRLGPRASATWFPPL